jgi:hypothetical protein
MRRPRVEILYFDGCPNYAHARELVQTAAEELELDVQIELVEVDDPGRAAELRFLGSPTVRVNGHDVEPGADEREEFTFSCRIYRTDGGIVETPEPHWIVEALAARAT